MAEIFRDPLWQFIGTILGFLAIITSLILFFLQRKKKLLSYDVVFDSKIFSEHKRWIDNLEILYDGKPVDNVHLLAIRFTNTGNVPIVSSDYEKKIEFSLGEEITILSAQILKSVPNKLAVNIENINNKIIIEPLLLNPKDSISIEVIISGDNYKIDVNARIIGIKSISRGLDILPMFPMTLLGYLIISIGIIVIFIGFINTGFNTEIEKYFAPGIAFLIIGFYLLLLRLLLRPQKYGLMFIELARIINRYRRKNKA